MAPWANDEITLGLIGIPVGIGAAVSLSLLVESRGFAPVEPIGKPPAVIKPVVELPAVVEVWNRTWSNCTLTALGSGPNGRTQFVTKFLLRTYLRLAGPCRGRFRWLTESQNPPIYLSFPISHILIIISRHLYPSRARSPAEASIDFY